MGETGSGLPRYSMLIGGAAVGAISGATFESQNPYTGRPWAVVPDGAPADVDAAVAARMRRQDVLHTSGKTFHFVILEAALRTRLCPPDVMAGQLDRLLGLDGLANVSFGILPTAVELPVAPLHGFLQLDQLTVVETFASSIRLHGEEATVYDQIMGIVEAAAVHGDDARHLILAAAKECRADRP